MFIQFFQFHFVGIIVEAYYLQHFVTSSISGDEGWLIKNPYNGATVHTYNCGGNTIFGGYEIFGCQLSTQTSIMKYFMLPPHYKVRLDINFWKINDWPNSQHFYIIVDQWTQSWYFTDNSGSNLCAGPGTDYSSPQYNDFPLHTLNSIIVELYSDCSITNFWGLTDFSITINECYKGCQFCLDPTIDCIMWIQWVSYFQLQNLDDGLEGWIKNKFPYFTYQTNDLQLKMLVLNQLDSAITYLTLPDHISLIIQFRIEYLSAMPITVRVYINDEWKYGLISDKKYVDYRTWTIDDTKNKIKLEIYSVDGTVCIRELSVIIRGPINLIQCADDNLVPFDGCFSKQESCLEGCTFCVKGECLLCDTRWDYNALNKNCEPSCGDKIITGNEQCDDGNELPLDGCHECQFSCPINCKNCSFGQCQVCNLGYYCSNGICNRNYDKLLQDKMQVDYNLLSYSLFENDVAVCGDNIVEQEEQCDDGNSILNDGCYNCYFQCVQNCQECIFGVCYNCSPTYELINGKCLELQTQFRFLSCIRLGVNQNLIFEQNDLTCSTDSDLYYNVETSGIEKNNIIFQCTQFCDICEYGKCKKCLVDYFLLNNLCISQIRKGALLFKDELQLNLIEIGCYKCNNSCQIQCLQCVNSYCFSCINGWSLINGICQQICGDNQVAMLSLEECDSNLSVCLNCRFVCPDNCQICINSKECLICHQPFVEINHECQLTCSIGCKKCIDGICHDDCPNGEINIGGICFSICGDGIRQQQELCDDGNNIQFDGCFNCEYSCPLYCENCEEGICQVCQKQFQLIQNVCYDVCGSGIKSYNEQCDDNNLIDVDGCSSNCKIEVDYKCQDKTSSYSECQYSESPYMIAQFLNQTYNKYYIEISFTQAISFRNSNDLQSLFDFIVDEASLDDFAIRLESNHKPVINQFLNFEFYVEIEFFQSTNNTLIKFQISLLDNAFNQYDMEVLNPSEQILLKQYTKLSQDNVEKVKQLTQYQEAMIMAQGIGSVIVLISGNFQIFVEILDNLQYQSYLKYINIIYPENLYLFFESTNLISIIPILDFLKIGRFYQIFLYSDFIESYAKLKFYNLNAHLITNLQFFVIQVISTFIFVMILKVICSILFRLIYKIQIQNLLILKLRTLQSKILIKTLNWIYNFFHFIFIFVYQFYQDGAEGLLLANAWDILFKIFLYLESSSNQDSISLIQTVLSYLTCAATGKFIIQSLKRGFSKKDNNLKNRYKAIYLLKQFFFCYFLLCFQSHSLIQLLMLTTTNLIYLFLLTFVEFKLDKLDKLQIILLEISIIAFTLTSIFHLKDYNYLISEENKILLGFAQIYLLISGIMGIFIKQIIMIFQQIKHRCLQYKKKEIASKKVTHLIFESVI